MNNFDLRLQTYSNFIKKRRGNESLDIIIRELKKFYQLGIDDFYPEEQRKEVINELIREGETRTDAEERAVFFLFAYKINKANNFDIEVPIVYLDETLIVSDLPNKMPESVLETFREKDKIYYREFYQASLPDQESLELYNIQIIPGYFSWNPISACLRGIVDEDGNVHLPDEAQ